MFCFCIYRDFCKIMFCCIVLIVLLIVGLFVVMVGVYFGYCVIELKMLVDYVVVVFYGSKFLDVNGVFLDLVVFWG